MKEPPAKAIAMMKALTEGWPEAAFPNTPEERPVIGALFMMTTSGNEDIRGYAYQQVIDRTQRYYLDMVKTGYPTYFTRITVNGDKDLRDTMLSHMRMVVIEKAPLYSPEFAPVTYFKNHFRQGIREAIAETQVGCAATSHFVEQQKKIRQIMQALTAEGIEPTVETIYRYSMKMDEEAGKDRDPNRRDRSRLSRQSIADNLEKMEGRQFVSIDTENFGDIADRADTPDEALIKKERQEFLTKFITENLTEIEIAVHKELVSRGYPESPEKKQDIAKKLGITMDQYNMARSSAISKLAAIARTGKYGDDVRTRYGRITAPTDSLDLLCDPSYDYALDDQLDNITEIHLDAPSLAGERKLKVCHERKDHKPEDLRSVRRAGGTIDISPRAESEAR